MITCCGMKLKTRKDVLKHFKAVPFTGDRRPLFACDKHKRHVGSCEGCQGAAFVNAIDRSLWASGLTLTDNVEES